MTRATKCKRTVNFRLNTSLAPARLISVCSVGKHIVDDFNMGWELLLPHGKGILGEGTGPSSPLAPDRFIDLFVYDPRYDIYEVSASGHPRAIALPAGHMLLLEATWSGTDGNGEGGIASLLWTHDELTKGKRPRLAFGIEAEQIRRYVHRTDTGATPTALALNTHVRRMTRRDLRDRQSREKQLSRSMTNIEQSTSPISLHISGYRGFRETGLLTLAQPQEDRPGSGLTVVVGANNAGKSTVWESFDALARKRDQDVSFSVERRNQLSDSGVRIGLTWADGTSYVVSSLHPDTSETKSDWLPESASATHPLRIVVIPSRRYFRATFGKNSGERPDWMSTGGMGYSRYEERDRFTGRLFALHADAVRKAQFDELLERVLGHKLDWRIDLAEGQGGGSYFLKVTTEGVTHNSDGLGDGIISLLFILDALYDPEPNSLLVIDEPELSLHPQLIRRLGRELTRVSSFRQIVIFTHSPLLVSWDAIAAGAEIARVYKEGQDSRIAQVPRDRIDEVSKVRGGWKNPHALGSDANEALFLDDEIIVVEGQEDAGLLATVFEQSGVTPRGTVFGWGSGGGDGNPRRIIGLLDGLGFTKVVALLDADKPDEVIAIREAYPHYFATTIPADDIRDKPASPSKGKEGLLDKDGRHLKESFKLATQETLRSVVDYFEADPKPLDS
ncbi:AAA family ATPase [Microbacterium sp. NPDC019599]|uniref:ATP-dependent nuclease n=1 Tax=Microbacterium sp. NPDC019599 TaxID=3154690 RepID=UPI0033D802A0